jgi:hypothetical protein
MRSLTAGFRRVMFGSADMSWEQGYYQLHIDVTEKATRTLQSPCRRFSEGCVKF